MDPKGTPGQMVSQLTLLKPSKKAIPLILDLATKYTTTEISTTADKRLFSSIMTLIPKSSKSNDITNFRPITIKTRSSDSLVHYLTIGFRIT